MRKITAFEGLMHAKKPLLSTYASEKRRIITSSTTDTQRKQREHTRPIGSISVTLSESPDFDDTKDLAAETESRQPVKPNYNPQSHHTRRIHAF